MMAPPAIRLAPLCVGAFFLAGIVSAAANDREGFRASDPLFLSSPLKALKVATLDLPRPLGTGLYGPNVSAPIAADLAEEPIEGPDLADPPAEEIGRASGRERV